jgi:hypothetical protein
VPFIPDSPTLVFLKLQVIGHVSLSLERAAFFFNSGLEFKVFADSGVNPDNAYFGNTDFVFQVTPQISLTAGAGLTVTNDAFFDLHGKALYALSNSLDFYVRPGFQLAKNDGPFISVGVDVWQ